jgi:polyhydroxyalkanoate synthesis regulator phasin
MGNSSKESKSKITRNNISNVILQSVNLPSKEEIDEVYKEMHSLKKRVSKLELELKKEKRKNVQ